MLFFHKDRWKAGEGHRLHFMWGIQILIRHLIAGAKYASTNRTTNQPWIDIF